MIRVLVFLVAMTAFAFGQEAMPLLTAANAVVDFGEKPQGVEFTGTFTLKNPTDAVVSVSAVVFHCSCSKGTMRTKDIPAKGEAILDFTFNTRNFEGAVSKTAEVFTVGGPKNGLILTIKGVVRPNWFLDKDTIDLGAVKPGDVFERKAMAEVRAGTDIDLEFRSAQADTTCTAVKISDEPKKWDIQLKITIPLGAPIGEFSRAIVVRAPSDKNKPAGFLTIVGRIEGDLTVTPRTLSFGRVANDHEERRTVVIESKSGREFQVIEIKADASLVIEGDRRVAKKRHEFTFVLQKGLAPRAYRSTVIFVLDHGDENRLVVSSLAQVEKP